jgi:hypothetical protein
MPTEVGRRDLMKTCFIGAFSLSSLVAQPKFAFALPPPPDIPAGTYSAVMDVMEANKQILANEKSAISKKGPYLG